MQARLSKLTGLLSQRMASISRASRHRELREAGDAARDAKNWSAAARFYGELITEDPSALDIAVQLGHAHKESGDYDRAAQLYYAVLSEKPNDDDLHLQIGHLEKLRDNISKAIDHYKLSMDLNPKNFDARREYDALKDRRTASGNGETEETRNLQSPGTTANGDTQAHARGGDGSEPLGVRQGSQVADKFQQVSTGVLRVAGDRARDAHLWIEAIQGYREYLHRVPDDVAIWIQLGHSLKESGDLAGGEMAYRRGLAINPNDHDLYLQLGHILKLRGKKTEATEAYRRSFTLRPLRATAVELRSLGIPFPREDQAADQASRVPKIFFEITDLFDGLYGSKTIEGIQRVQLAIVSYILQEHKAQNSLDCRLAAWEGDDLWLLQEPALEAFVSHYQRSGGGEFEQRRTLITNVLATAELLHLMSDDVVVTTGTLCSRPDLVRGDEKLKRAGARLGAYIHDFIPLTHPEFCDRALTNAYSNTMAELVAPSRFRFDDLRTCSARVAPASSASWLSDRSDPCRTAGAHLWHEFSTS